MAGKIYCSWVGEFGWELMTCQAYMRYLSLEHDVYIWTRKGQELLYKDFAKEIITHEIPPSRTSKWMDLSFPRNRFSYYFNRELEEGDIWFAPNTPVIDWEKNEEDEKFKKQVFIKFGNYKPELAFDIILHARETKKCGTIRRNWEHWEEFACELSGLRVGCIGHPEQSRHVIGEDLRGLPLETLADVLASSRLIVGGSSGPMHLAALCGCPTAVWWGDNRSRNRRRYNEAWNPLKTPVIEVLNDWQPSVEQVVSKIEEFSKILKW